MADVWLPNAEHIPNRVGRGNSYAAAPFRFVAHTTEVIPSTLDGARSMAEQHRAPPQLWAWPERRWLGQTVPLDRAAFALKHPKGTPETNRQGALQVEVIGFAKDTPHWPELWWDWLGSNVLAAVVAAGFPVNLDRVAPVAGVEGYGPNGTVRMDWDEWAGFDGVCGHANVPGNEHWDPGVADLRRVAVMAKRTLGLGMAVPLPAPPAPIPSGPRVEESLLMAVALNDDDARDAFVRMQCQEYWGRPPRTVKELNLLKYVLATQGAAALIVAVEAHELTKELRDRRGW